MTINLKKKKALFVSGVKRKRKYEPTASSDPNVFVFDGLPPKDTDHGKNVKN
jgi:hypothetical protein